MWSNNHASKTTWHAAWRSLHAAATHGLQRHGPVLAPWACTCTLQLGVPAVLHFLLISGQHKALITVRLVHGCWLRLVALQVVALVLLHAAPAAAAAAAGGALGYAVSGHARRRWWWWRCLASRVAQWGRRLDARPCRGKHQGSRGEQGRARPRLTQPIPSQSPEQADSPAKIVSTGHSCRLSSCLFCRSITSAQQNCKPLVVYSHAKLLFFRIISCERPAGRRNHSCLGLSLFTDRQPSSRVMIVG